MGKRLGDRVAVGQVPRMRLVLGGRVEIEQAIVHLCAQRHIDYARFNDLMRRLDGTSRPALRAVATGFLLPPVLPND